MVTCPKEAAAGESREFYNDLAVRQYFASVDRKDLNAVLDCFNADAVFTIPRRFRVNGRDIYALGRFHVEILLVPGTAPYSFLRR